MKNLKTDSTKILLMAIGNCGRGDDGLGWKFADLLQEKKNENINIEYRYQLQVEDAELICYYDTIIFADASHEKQAEGFEIKPCIAAGHFYYSSHIQSPETIMFLANNLNKKYTEAYAIAISGNDWELKTSLSAAAEKNLQLALIFFNKEFLPTIHPLADANKNTLTV